MTRQIRLVAFFAALISSPAYAALVLQQGDGPVPAVYANGGGSGFGGTLGNGSISMDVVGTNLVVGFTPGNSLNDIVGLFLDTKSGGFVDADMNDTADGSRRVLSNLAANANDVFPAGVLPDYGVTFGNFGTVLFELQAGTNLNFLQFTGTVGSITIPLATIGNPTKIDFFAAYVSDSGYSSNESLPYSASLQASGNPGFGDGQFGGLNTGGTYDNFNRFFTTAVPEASTFAVWGLMMMTVGLVRRRFK